MKKLLITGSSGFIGQNLIPKLDEYEIFGLTNCFHKNPNHIKKNIHSVKLKDVPKDISLIIHLAAVSDILYCDKNPEECFKTNVVGTQNILEIARETNAKVIFVSSSHVYGSPKKNPVKENSTLDPLSFYGTSKMIGEELCKIYSKLYGLDISVVRLFSVYGPHSPKHLIINKIIKNALLSKEIELGNTFPKRDFIYVDDVVSGIKKILKNTRDFQIFNLGSGKSNSINNIIKIIQSELNKEVKIKKSKSLVRKNEIENVCANIDTMKKLKWIPLIMLDEGIQKTIEWHNSQLV